MYYLRPQCWCEPLVGLLGQMSGVLVPGVQCGRWAGGRLRGVKAGCGIERRP